MRTKKSVPEVNAGSMADIAFLLLIFFLVTASIENDSGLNRMLPQENTEITINIKRENLFEISINLENELMVEGDIVDLKYLREMTIAFLDNGGISQGQIGFCEYCQGDKNERLSENPEKAIISLRTCRNSDYSFYVSVQNEIMGAYNHLRNREARRLYGENYESLVSDYNKFEAGVSEKLGLKRKIEALRSMYPLKLIEPETINH